MVGIKFRSILSCHDRLTSITIVIQLAIMLTQLAINRISNCYSITVTKFAKMRRYSKIQKSVLLCSFGFYLNSSIQSNIVTEHTGEAQATRKHRIARKICSFCDIQHWIHRDSTLIQIRIHIVNCGNRWNDEITVFILAEIQKSHTTNTQISKLHFCLILKLTNYCSLTVLTVYV